MNVFSALVDQELCAPIFQELIDVTAPLNIYLEVLLRLDANELQLMFFVNLILIVLNMQFVLRVLVGAYQVFKLKILIALVNCFISIF